MENGFYVAASTQFIADGNTLRELLATGQVQITDASGQPVNVVSGNCNLLKTCKKTVHVFACSCLMVINCLGIKMTMLFLRLNRKLMVTHSIFNPSLIIQSNSHCIVCTATFEFF